MDTMNVSHQPPLSEEQLRWIEHVHQLEYVDHAVPRRTGAVEVEDEGLGNDASLR